MSKSVFITLVLSVAIVFIGIFCVVVIPPLLENPDIVGAFGAGFVNPFASGYSADVISCWVILSIWILYEFPKVKYGWICILLGIVPGVAVGFAGYLWLRSTQLN